MNSPNFKKGPIAWMADNSVAANILMFILIVGGLINMSRIKQEIFPKFSLDMVSVNIIYPGANPSEIETGILLALEEGVRGIDGVKRVSSTATEGLANVNIQLMLNANPDKVLSDVKTAVDGIQSFPENIEKPVIRLLASKEEVITLILYGKVNERSLRHYAEELKEALLKEPTITYTEFQGIRDRELTIEVPQASLQAHNLSLQDIANLVGMSSIDIPAGELETTGGDLALRTNNRIFSPEEFEKLEIKTDQSGSKLRLADIAVVIDGFEDKNNQLTFDDMPAMSVKVFRTGDQKPIEIAERAKAVAERMEKKFPLQLKVSEWGDFSKMFSERVDLLKRNAFIGLILVFFVLAIFLEFRLAFWVTMGILASFIGSFLFMPAFDISINMISLFAFIITLGIVVDDAIVVGENIFEERHKRSDALLASIVGTKKIAGPVVFAVLTTITAFMPMFFVPGIMGKFFVVIPSIVVIVLVISLIESLYILPSHLAHTPSIEKKTGIRARLHESQKAFSKKFNKLVHTHYPPIASSAAKNRYVTLGAFTAVLIISLALIGSGRIPFTFMPNIDSDILTISASYPLGTPQTKTQALSSRLVVAAQKTMQELGGEHQSKGILAQIGQSLMQSGPHMAAGSTNSASVDVMVLLVPSNERDFSSEQFMEAWRKNIGDIAGLKTIKYRSSMGPSAGEPIDIQVKHPNANISETIGKEIASELETFAGVVSIQDGISEGKNQLDFQLNQEGRRLGFTAFQMGQEIRNAFFGAIAARQQRDRDEIKVVVRLPKIERRSEYAIENFFIKTPSGQLVPLKDITSSSRGVSYAQIKREDGQRITNVKADVVLTVANPTEIIDSIQQEIFPKIQAKYPEATFSFAGEQREQAETMGSLGLGFLIALFVIYALLAIPFKSYIQPLIVMSAIPFGLVCAVLGHIIMGYGLSLISIMGIVALSGIVVNDSLVLVYAANEDFRESNDALGAVVRAGARRFRPILLTSVTTFLGLAPMIFETSMQARFLIPMAISLGFGVLFSTFITLILVPALYVIIDDFRSKTSTPPNDHVHVG